jgi:fructosamine-3-kinase
LIRVAGVDLHDPEPVGGGDICHAWRATSAEGRMLFAKSLDAAPAGFFVAEARGLDLLRVDGGPPVPAVVAVADDGLVLEWVPPGAPTAAAAEEFGRALARLHGSTVASYGAAADGFIGSLPLPNAGCAEWAEFYVERRVRPFLGGLTSDERHDVEELCASILDVAGPSEPPARIHGDLWSGNVLWARDGRAWVVDAASAHGGHRETDLAMLDLFGVPYLDRIRASYQEIAPLADGWRERIPLHQLHPLLVHASMFGGGYGGRAAAAARAMLRHGLRR